MFCPMTKKDCKKDCVWFTFKEGNCSVVRLDEINDRLDEINDRLDELNINLKLLSNAMMHYNDCKGY